jgi:hypothetical protein
LCVWFVIFLRFLEIPAYANVTSEFTLPRAVHLAGCVWYSYDLPFIFHYINMPAAYRIPATESKPAELKQSSGTKSRETIQETVCAAGVGMLPLAAHILTFES